MEEQITVKNDSIALNGMPEALKAILRNDPEFFLIIKQGIAKQVEMSQTRGLCFWCYPPSGLLQYANKENKNLNSTVKTLALNSKLNFTKYDTDSDIFAEMPDPRCHLIGYVHQIEKEKPQPSKHRRSLSQCALSRYKQKFSDSSRHIASHSKVDV
jgi:hypothetical protein